MKERRGYYFVKLVNLNWTIAYWDRLEQHWIMLGETKPCFDSDFIEIKEEPIKLPE